MIGAPTKVINFLGDQSCPVILLLVIISCRRNMKTRTSAALLLCATFFTHITAHAEDELYHGPGAHAHPDGRGNRVVGIPRRSGSGGAVVTGNGIDYNGGPVMHGTVKVYFIMYGDWSQDPAALGILSTWASSIGGTPYANINST